MIVKMNTIEKISDSDLCTGCGTCAGVCPYEAIVMQHSKGLMLPIIDEEKCTYCGICITSCPGHVVDFKSLNSHIFLKQPKNNLLGNFLNCYVGHSIDENIRYNSSSGGIATKLLIFALDRGYIDGALVVKMNENSPFEPLPFIARTKKEIISASKSKYCPVSLNEALKEIIKEDGRFAVVGLPCHIHGIRKAESVISHLEKKIVLHVGLMCSKTVNFQGTMFLLNKLRLRKDQVVRLDYRGLGWPGTMSIRCKNGSDIRIPYVRNWNSYFPVFSSFFFVPMRCLTCPDQTNELADISLGDAWLSEFKHESIGKSIIVTRTSTAEEILNLAASEGVISIKSVTPDTIERSQAGPLKFKKDDFGTRLAFFKLLGKVVPSFDPNPNSTFSLFSFLRTFFCYFNSQASANKMIRKLLTTIPFPLFRLYFGVYKYLSMI